MKSVLKRLFGEEFNNLLAMNLITAVLCVPVVTAGPALLALMGTLIKIMDNRCSLSRVKEYKALFKKKFWKGVQLEAVLLAYGAAMVWCLSLGSALGEQGVVLRVAAMAALFLAGVVSVPVALILAAVEIPFHTAFWNGVCLALGRFPRAILSALCVYGAAALGVLFYPISLVLFIVIMISTTAVVSLAILWPAFYALVLDTCDSSDGSGV